MKYDFPGEQPVPNLTATICFLLIGMMAGAHFGPGLLTAQDQFDDSNKAAARLPDFVSLGRSWNLPWCISQWSKINARNQMSLKNALALAPNPAEDSLTPLPLIGVSALDSPSIRAVTSDQLSCGE